jgi:hypothetical protein
LLALAFKTRRRSSLVLGEEPEMRATQLPRQPAFVLGLTDHRSRMAITHLQFNGYCLERAAKSKF